MVPKLRDILDILEEAAPADMAEVWDNSGLQVGFSSHEIRKIFVSLDPTLKAVQKASKRNAQLLLTHHPLIFKSLSSLNQENFPGNVIFEAIGGGIAIVAAHTNLDVTQGGINDLLANLFGLQDVEVLQKKDGLEGDNAGLGRIGYLPKPVRLSSMVETVKVVVGAKRVRVVGHKNSKIRRVAVVGGSGGKMVSMASERGAELLITGDIRHHEALEAETVGLALIDGGHFHIEKVALRHFVDGFRSTLKDREWDVSVEVYDNEKGPMRDE